MAIAKLSIDLEAKLANLQAGLDKAGLLAERNARRIEQSFAAVRSTVTGVGAALGVVLAPAALGAFFKATNDGLLKIKDLSEATGASIENVSALEDVARKAGGSFEDFSGVLVKFNAALKDSDKTKELGEAFKRLGLNVQELKQLDPAEALRRVAVAMSGFADDGEKARLTQELFGKSVKEAAPYLRELAEAGQLNATVTAEQVMQADKFNKSMAALQVTILGLSREAFAPMVIELNQMSVAFTKADGALEKFLVLWNGMVDSSRNFQGELISKILGKTAADDVRKLAAELAAIDKRLSVSGTFNVDRGAFEKRRQEILQRITLLQAMAGAEDAANYGNEGRRTVSLPSIGGGGGAAAKTGKSAKQPNELIGPEQSDALKEALKAIDQTDPAKLQRLNAQLQELLTIRPADAQGAASLAEAIRATRDQIDQFDPAVQAAAEQAQKLAAIIQATPTGQLQAVLTEIELINKAFSDGTENTELWAEAIGVATGKLKGAADDAQQLGEDVGDELGLIFGSAASKAIVEFESLSSVLKGILKDIAQIALRDTITKPLSDAVSGALKGFSFASLLTSADGNAFGTNGLIRYAKGGIVNSPTLFKFASGTGLMGEAGPEAILPLKRGRGGQLGVASQGGGGTITYAPVIHIDSRTDRDQVAALVQQSVQQGNAQLMRYLKGQGMLA